MNEKDFRTALLVQPVPDEHIAEERTWETVRAAFLAREPVSRPRRVPRRLLLLLALCGAGVAIALSPAGPEIGGWARDTLGRDRTVVLEPAEAPIRPLPAPGRLLVSSGGALWVVEENGAKRHLGAYDGADWSPRGVFVAAWSGSELVALDPDEEGFVHWTVRAPRIADARWSSSGFRLAYRSAGSLRVVVENGTGDRELAPAVAPVAPAWKPGQEETLAYADADGRVRVVDADSGKLLWRTAQAPPPVALAWTGDGERLAVLGERRLRVLEAPRRLLFALRLPEGEEGTALAPRPGTREVAYATAAGAGESAVFLQGERRGDVRLLFAGAGRIDRLAWSPDGTLLLVGWEAADQWLYLPPRAGEAVIVATSVSAEFDSPSFPLVEAWCCPGGG